MGRFGKYFGLGALLVFAVLIVNLTLRKYVIAAPSGCESNGQCYVTASGAGSRTGLDWNNAYDGLPTSPVCGVTYYLAGGNYDYTSISTTISGSCTPTTPITIYKAVSAGPGNPQTVAGWQSGFGTSQAVFSQSQAADPEANASPFFTFTGTYITLDGVTPSTGTPCKYGTGNGSAITCPAAYGIVLRTPNKAQLAFAVMSGAAANITMKHIEFDGTRPYFYGAQVTSCSWSGGNETLNLANSVQSAWASGDHIDVENWNSNGSFGSLVAQNVAITAIGASSVTYAVGSSATCTGTGTTRAVLNYPGTEPVYFKSTANPSNISVTDNYIHDIGGGMAVNPANTVIIERTILPGRSRLSSSTRTLFPDRSS